MTDQENQEVRHLTEDGLIEDAPQELTESYGTGVKLRPGMTIGGRTRQERIKQYHSLGPELTGGDIDADWSEAENTGEETVGGTVATPDQDIVDDLGKAVGTEMRDREDFYGTDKYNLRDQHRWELDPKSSEDYAEHHE